MFRSPSSNQLMTLELIWETANAAEGREFVLYTLKPYDREGAPSLYKLYMECADTSEYTFAKKYFESWDHWMKVRNNGRIAPIINKWAAELEFKLRKEAFDRIKEAAENGSLEANKFIVNANFIDGIPEKVMKNGKLTNVRPVGRPSNKQVSSEELANKEEMDRVVEDLKRLSVN